MLKVFQARLQQYMNQSFQTFKLDLEKAEEPEIANIRWIIEKAKEVQKNIYFCFIDCTKALDCGSHQTVENVSRDRNNRPPYLPPEKPVCRSRSNRARHRKTDCFQTRKGVSQSYIWSPCLFNLYAEYIMQNAGLDESQTRIKITGKNINNLRYADDTTFLAESKDELKSLLKVK